MAILTETPPGHGEVPLLKNAEKKTVIETRASDLDAASGNALRNAQASNDT